MSFLSTFFIKKSPDKECFRGKTLLSWSEDENLMRSLSQGMNVMQGLISVLWPGRLGRHRVFKQPLISSHCRQGRACEKYPQVHWVWHVRWRGTLESSTLADRAPLGWLMLLIPALLSMCTIFTALIERQKAWWMAWTSVSWKGRPSIWHKDNDDFGSVKFH